MRARLLIAVLVLPLAIPTPAQAVETYISGEGSTIFLGSTSIQDGTVRVQGTIELGYWSIARYAPYPTLDYPGYYLGSTIQSFLIENYPSTGPEFDADVLFHLGLIDRVHPVLAPVAFSWPVAIDSREEGKWLGAGAIGTGNPPATATSGWTGMCTDALDVCEHIELAWLGPTGPAWWTSNEELGAKPGSVLTVGAANGGVVSSFAWPATPGMGGAGALSTSPEVPDVKLIGEVRLGIAPEGTPLDEVEYTAEATLGADTNENPRPWSGELAAPTLPGSYVLHAQTCWGLVDDLDCDHRSIPLSI